MQIRLRAREACRQQLAQWLEEDRALAATAVDLTAAALERGLVEREARHDLGRTQLT